MLGQSMDFDGAAQHKAMLHCGKITHAGAAMLVM
jgi:hypothetical protein